MRGDAQLILVKQRDRHATYVEGTAVTLMRAALLHGHPHVTI